MACEFNLGALVWLSRFSLVLWFGLGGMVGLVWYFWFGRFGFAESVW